MNSVFKADRQFNKWDNLAVDVKAIYESYPAGRTVSHVVDTPTTALFRGLYKSPFLPLSARRFLRKICFQSHLDESWFHEFSQYWFDILDGRPLWGVQDFYFLMNLYRMRFQDNQIPETGDASVHLEAWQRPELLYQLMHLVYKETIVDYAHLIRKMYSYGRRIQNFLEFGCGIGPVTASLYQFFDKQPEKIYFSDIQTIAFHYATHRFARYKNAEPLLLTPDNDFRLTISEPLDVITCLTVFEHLNKPFETVCSFYENLRPGGLLFFDYIKTDGECMDTVQGANERANVLDYVALNFDILEGDISKEKSTGLIIAKKK